MFSIGYIPYLSHSFTMVHKKHEAHTKAGAKHIVVMTEAQHKRHLANPLHRHTKGTRSVTRPGDMDYTSKRGDRVHHIGGHDVKERRAPFARRRRAPARRRRM